MDTATLNSLVTWLEENKQFSKEELLKTAKENSFTEEEFEEAWNKFKTPNIQHQTEIPHPNNQEPTTEEQHEVKAEVPTPTENENNEATYKPTLETDNPLPENNIGDTIALENTNIAKNDETTDTVTEANNKPETETTSQTMENNIVDTLAQNDNSLKRENDVNTQIPRPKTDEMTPNFQTSTVNKKKSGLKQIIIIVVIILGLIVFGIVAYAVTKNTNFKFKSTNEQKEDLTSKYDKDTDGDAIPDVIETELGTNPMVSILESCNTNNCETNLKNAPKTNILFIMDASGSMAQKIDGVSKMDIAKQAMTELLNTLDTNNLDMGLMVYGLHGSNSTSQKALSCSQIDLLQPIATGNTTALKSSISTIKATGWTPIEKSLNQALASFNGKEVDNNNVILITDGLEQCGGTPVNAALKLASKNIKVSVVGFGISDSDSSTLLQIANAGKGTFTNASSSTTLINAIKAKVDNSKAIYANADCKIDTQNSKYKCVNDKYEESRAFILNLMTKEQKENGYSSPQYLKLKEIYNTVVEKRTTVSKSLSEQTGNIGQETKNELLNDQKKNDLNTNLNKPKEDPNVSGFQ